jgi:hypothetical protein
MKITVENKEYEVDEKDENIMGVVRTLTTGSNSLHLLNHIAQCVQAIQNTKTDELKGKLTVTEDEVKLKLNPKE